MSDSEHPTGPEEHDPVLRYLARIEGKLDRLIKSGNRHVDLTQEHGEQLRDHEDRLAALEHIPPPNGAA